jgi:DNA-3-methyladenine glycosylase I
MNTNRCKWATNDPLYIEYHDNEWGIPKYDDKELFELLILETMQAGLSWITILKKRENYRQCLDNFDPEKIALYNKDKIELLLSNPGIIRNRLKIESIINNAKAYLVIKKDFDSFSDYIWKFVDGKPIINNWDTHEQIPSFTDLSNRLSIDLKKRGFKFIGSTICYAFMQASGMVNDHTTNCFCHNSFNI